MPDLIVCTGVEFGTGDLGELKLAGANDNPWTLPGLMADENALNVDPAGGVWTAPHGCYSWLSQQTNKTLSTALAAGGTYSAPLTAVTIANPSSASKMRLTVAVKFRMYLTSPAGGLVYHRASLLYGGSPATVWTMASKSQPISASVPIVDSQTEVLETLVAAGASVTLQLAQSFVSHASSAAMTVTGYEADIAHTGWLIDPTQAGGVS